MSDISRTAKLVDYAFDGISNNFAATADEAAKVRNGMVILGGSPHAGWWERRHRENKYANDPGKLAAWLSADHVEKAPKKKETPTP